MWEQGEGQRERISNRAPVLTLRSWPELESRVGRTHRCMMDTCSRFCVEWWAPGIHCILMLCSLHIYHLYCHAHTNCYLKPNCLITKKKNLQWLPLLSSLVIPSVLPLPQFLANHFLLLSSWFLILFVLGKLFETI